MKAKLIAIISTKIFKKILFAVVAVLVGRTDNQLDDEIYEAIKNCF